MYYFCTYFDSNYLVRGLTLYRSLVKSGCVFELYALALDDKTYETLSKLALPNLHPISMLELENWEPRLLLAKKNRSKIEFYFTLSPILPLYILDTKKRVELITYLDADLFFYHSPEPIFQEMGNASILITEHRFPAYLKDKEKFGRYNVQYQSFRRDKQGLACLDRWREQCLEWCYDRLEDGKYADQKYLEEWPQRYEQLVVVQQKGGGLAPWNWATHPLNLSNNSVAVAGEPLIFYHFHGVKIFYPWFISNGLLDFGMMPYRLRRWFYVGYLRQLRSTRKWLVEQDIRDIFLKDKFTRGRGISVATLGEIFRKAWAQGMITY